ncbi:F-type H+-transporting ATPase subunit epsilon [Janibacter indicus]|uniref:ATP synthase epsilon chain n=1 Tax=Janibacter indicus TaxID=857417 RepID=A0A1W1Y5N9_9MICO|nr:F-type H+-transporting ATPase subunit epsilon [Janibacter indicus]
MDTRTTETKDPPPVSSLNVELVAADRKVWSGEASMVRARSTEGEIGIMPGHTPLLGVLIEGDIVIHTTEGGDQAATIDGGFLSVDHDNVTIVAETVQTPAKA